MILEDELSIAFKTRDRLYELIVVPFDLSNVRYFYAIDELDFSSIY